MVEHWKTNGVPTYMAISAVHGLIKKGGKKKEEYGDLEDLEAMFEGSGGFISG